ncbi:MAG: DUF1289 domain-containing protein [Pseudorhodobacter sp.]|nr:DUF1289 domain-containing protein [Pseudorhodobacter sp.]
MKDVEAKDGVWQRDEIESPCIKLCVVHPAEHICVGCMRSVEEIANWSRMTQAARAAVMAELPNRAPALARRRGGRAARLKR